MAEVEGAGDVAGGDVVPAEGEVGTGGNEKGTVIEGQGAVSAAYDWKQDIHPDVKSDKLWESVPDLKTLTKAHADAVRYNVGAIKMPGKDATPEEVDSFHRKLGRPESAEGYQLSEVLQADPVAPGMRPVAHSAGLTPTQWDKLTEGWVRLNQDRVKADEQLAQKTTDELKSEWGAAYDQKLGLTQRLIKTVGGEDAWNEISTHKLANSPTFIRMMAKMAGMMAEEELIPLGGETTESMEHMKAELEAVTNSREYLDGRHPMHASTVEKAKKLFEIVYS